MGFGYLRPLSTWNQANEIFRNWDQLFHQVGGSRALSKDHIAECQKIHLEEHCMEVWGA